MPAAARAAAWKICFIGAGVTHQKQLQGVSENAGKGFVAGENQFKVSVFIVPLRSTEIASKNGGWCWQQKAALWHIRQALDGEHAVASGIAVYTSLTEIASDAQSQEFITTYLYIAMKSGVSNRTVGKRLKDLRDIGLITFYTPRLKSPLRIRMYDVAKWLPNEQQPLPNVKQRKKNTPLLTSEEYQKKVKNRKKKGRIFLKYEHD